jgi:hypothetical protein
MLYPGSKIDTNLAKELINLVYWPIYGEMTFKDVPNEKPELGGLQVLYGYMSTMIYVFIANVLLLNIVIAMFRYSYLYL